MNRKFSLTLAFVIFSLIVHATDNKNETDAILKSVTVYRSGAEMTHSANVILKQGNNELIIDDLSNTIDINSIQIKAPSTVTILSIEFSNNYLLTTEKTPHIQLLLDSLQSVQNEIDHLNVSIANTTELIDVLKNNKNIKGEQNGLSVAELSKLMDYYKSKLLELQNDILGLNKKSKKQMNEFRSYKTKLMKNKKRM